MAHTLEDMVAVLEATTSPFALADDLQIFQEGLADAARRIRALEAEGVLSGPRPARVPILALTASATFCRSSLRFCAVTTIVSSTSEEVELSSAASTMPETRMAK